MPTTDRPLTEEELKAYPLECFRQMTPKLYSLTPPPGSLMGRCLRHRYGPEDAIPAEDAQAEQSDWALWFGDATGCVLRGDVNKGDDWSAEDVRLAAEMVWPDLSSRVMAQALMFALGKRDAPAAARAVVERVMRQMNDNSAMMMLGVQEHAKQQIEQQNEQAAKEAADGD